MGTDLDQPLGQDRDQRSARRSRSYAAPAFGVLAIVVLAGLSAYTMLSPKGLTRSAPDTGDKPAAQETALANSVQGKDGKPAPQIPGSQIMPTDPRAGANVEHILTEDGQVIEKYTPKPRSGPVLIGVNEIGQDPRAAAFPVEAMLEDSPFGRLPKVSATGEKPWKRFARPWSGARGTQIAIIVTGLGLSQTGTQNAIRDLPEEITLAFASSGNSLSRWMQEARQHGHEILLQVPMEPFDYPANNPGNDTLLSSASKKANLDSLHRSMGKITNYTGVMNYLGGRFLSDTKAMEPVMRDITDRGLLFVDDGSSAQSLASQFSKAMNLPFVGADLQLDSEVNTQAVLRKLDQLESIARRKGSAVGVAAGFDEVVQAIRQWSESAPMHGLEIVGVSTIASQATGSAGQ